MPLLSPPPISPFGLTGGQHLAPYADLPLALPPEPPRGPLGPLLDPELRGQFVQAQMETPFPSLPNLGLSASEWGGDYPGGPTDPDRHRAMTEKLLESIPFAGVGMVQGRVGMMKSPKRIADYKKFRRGMRKGMDPRELTKETGWQMTPEGVPVYEVTDKGFKFNPQTTVSRLGDSIEHPTLLRDYPYLADVPVIVEKSEKAGGSFRTLPSGKTELHVRGPTAKARQSAALHEIQHQVSQVEGLARGGTLNVSAAERNWYDNEVEWLKNNLDDKMFDYDYNVRRQKLSEWVDKKRKPYHLQADEMRAEVTQQSPGLPESVRRELPILDRWRDIHPELRPQDVLLTPPAPYPVPRAYGEHLRTPK